MTTSPPGTRIHVSASAARAIDTAIDDAVERASFETVTKAPPKSAQAQMRFLTKTEKGSTKAVAARLGVSRRTVERYLAGQHKTPRAALREALGREVAGSWQPRVRQRARKRAATTAGLAIETRATFGYEAPAGTTDEARERLIRVDLPATYANRIFTAQRGESSQELRDIIAEGLAEVYFRDGGRRAQGLDVVLTDIDYIDMRFK
ncbi:XRE family transcriptional regulator [Streptomyces sp. NPDC047117]|uniref:telomere-protecting terminal protein Tpg n=1 Tax=Streptomyces sp. NPDC047117 TaxID=3155379 RepID=UPI00340F6B65